MEIAPRRLSETPSWQVAQLAVYARRLVNDGFADVGARGYHYRLLAALHEFGPASQVALGRRCGIDRSDVVLALNELAETEAVRRVADPADRRRNIVIITEAGEQRLDLLDRRLNGIQDALLAPLSGPEREVLAALLGRLLVYHTGA